MSKDNKMVIEKKYKYIIGVILLVIAIFFINFNYIKVNYLGNSMQKTEYKLEEMRQEVSVIDSSNFVTNQKINELSKLDSNIDQVTQLYETFVADKDRYSVEQREENILTNLESIRSIILNLQTMFEKYRTVGEMRVKITESTQKVKDFEIFFYGEALELMGDEGTDEYIDFRDKWIEGYTRYTESQVNELISAINKAGKQDNFSEELEIVQGFSETLTEIRNNSSESETENTAEDMVIDFDVKERYNLLLDMNMKVREITKNIRGE